MWSWSGCPKSEKQKDRLWYGCLQIGVKDWTGPDFKTLVWHGGWTLPELAGVQKAADMKHGGGGLCSLAEVLG